MAPHRCRRGRSGSGDLVLHQKGLDPVLVTLLANPIRDGGGLLRHLKPPAEGFGEPLQLGVRKVANGGVISRIVALSRGSKAGSSRPSSVPSAAVQRRGAGLRMGGRRVGGPLPVPERRNVLLPAAVPGVFPLEAPP